MKTEPHPPLKLPLDERNLAHFLAALALAALAARIPGEDKQPRTCWWTDDKQFAIRTEFGPGEFRQKLFEAAHEFLLSMKWTDGLGGMESGVLTAGAEFGTNPFVDLSGSGTKKNKKAERPAFRAFAGQQTPGKTLIDQQASLARISVTCEWLTTSMAGAGNWRFDCRTRSHALDRGIVSDAEKTQYLDPSWVAIELLSLAGASFFAAGSALQTEKRRITVFAWRQEVHVGSAALASSGRIRGLPAVRCDFEHRAAAHGKGDKFRYFPEAETHNEPAYEP